MRLRWLVVCIGVVAEDIQRGWRVLVQRDRIIDRNRCHVVTRACDFQRQCAGIRAAIAVRDIVSKGLDPDVAVFQRFGIGIRVVQRIGPNTIRTDRQ